MIAILMLRGSWMLSHLRLVISIARGYTRLQPAACRSDSGRQHRPDESRQRYDLDRGVRLVSFAIHWMKAKFDGHVLKELAAGEVATTRRSASCSSICGA